MEGSEVFGKLAFRKRTIVKTAVLVKSSGMEDPMRNRALRLNNLN